MKFEATISNEDVAMLPPVQFGGRIVVVDTPAALAEACDFLSAQSEIGFDTETRPSFRVGETNKVSLLQLATDQVCYLVRLNRLPLDRRLIALLRSAGIKKIGAGVLNDIAGLNALRRFKADGFVDLQDMVGEYGIENRSLRKISGIILGRKVSKAQRLSNWEARTLTPQQQMYAATDAWVCLEIWRRLQSLGDENR